MATYIIMFRLDYNSTYSDRWDSVVSKVRAEAQFGKTWEEMTSIIILESSKSADELASAIYIRSSFDATTDKLLVVNSANGAYATRSHIDNPASLASLFNSDNRAIINALME